MIMEWGSGCRNMCGHLGTLMTQGGNDKRGNNFKGGRWEASNNNKKMPLQVILEDFNMSCKKGKSSVRNHFQMQCS